MKIFLFFILSFVTIQTYALRPARNYIVTPDSFGLSYETLEIPSGDSNATLKAWKMLPAPAYDRKTTIIIAGGDAGNMSYCMQQAFMLVGNGFTVITFDYRGFGESSYFNINEKFLYYNEFAIDLAGVIKWARANLKDNRTGVLGFSMGTAMTVMASQTEALDFVILEGLLYNPFVVAIRVQAAKGTEVLIPENAEKLVALYNSMSCRMLVFAGTLDQITTVSDSKNVVKQDKKKRKLVTFKGNHLQGFEALSKKNYGDVYIEQVIKFIVK